MTTEDMRFRRNKTFWNPCTMVLFTSITSPTISCPITIGGVIRASAQAVQSYTLTSVPQIEAAFTFTKISSLPGVGIATCLSVAPEVFVSFTTANIVFSI